MSSGYIDLPVEGGGGGGTVTSVGLSAPASILSVTGSPVTTSGTLGLDLVVQNANKVWAGPTTGADANPTFRALVAADIPALPYVSTTLTNGNILVGNGSNVATSVAMSGEASIINTGAVTLSNAAVIAKVLTGYVSGAGTITASDSILTAIQKLNGNDGIFPGSSTANAVVRFSGTGGKTFKNSSGWTADDNFFVTQNATFDAATGGTVYCYLLNATPGAATVSAAAFRTLDLQVDVGRVLTSAIGVRGLQVSVYASQSAGSATNIGVNSFMDIQPYTSTLTAYAVNGGTNNAGISYGVRGFSTTTDSSAVSAGVVGYADTGPNQVAGVLAQIGTSTFTPTGVAALICSNVAAAVSIAKFYDNTTLKIDFKDGGIAQFVEGIQTKVSTANVSNPPTSAEIISAFGTAASTGAGWVGIINDNNADTDVWIIASDGTSYFYTAMTKSA